MRRIQSVLRSVALVMLLIPASDTLVAQEGKRSDRPGSARYTLTLRRPAWFGFAVECSGCDRPGVSDTARRPLIVSRVAAGGPASRGALQAGDTILAAGEKLVSARELYALLESATPEKPVRFLVGTSRGRFTYAISPRQVPVVTIGKDTLPVRYRGEFAEVTIDVLTDSTPVVTRDSTGAVLIRVGEHVVRLQRAP